MDEQYRKGLMRSVEFIETWIKNYGKREVRHRTPRSYALGAMEDVRDLIIAEANGQKVELHFPEAN